MQLTNSGEPRSDEVDPSQASAPVVAPKLKLKWGRERPPGAPGDRLLARLGPASPELAPFHNPVTLLDGRSDPAEDGQFPKIPLDTELDHITFVSLDCETTGHFPDRMVELGAVRFRVGEAGPSEPPTLLESLVHTTDHINPYARRVHGITRSMLTGAPSLRRVALTFHDFARGAILVEHSADAFDTRLVAKALDRPPPHHHLDTSRIAGFLFDLRDTIGLERLCERLEVTHRHPHFALADAEATADCFVKLVEIGRKEHGWRTLGDLVAVGMPPGPRPLVRPGRRPTVASAAAVEGSPSEQPRPRPRRRHRGGRRHRGATAAPAHDSIIPTS
ncbi:MAG: 3'-5' exonuclease [Candidatus Dormibacteria bacterium]